MTNIRILPDILVSKIAAGEVIERPSSVVKELIENSLDAGADKVVIKIESGGKRSISVSDNGSGMSRDNALMSLERHATSKIKSIEDLFNLNTLGFRGEALPSIASISRLRLTTRSAGDIAGTSIRIEGGNIKKVDETGCPFGTTVEVNNIFFNTPPRLKFLKKSETELIRITEVIQREAISNPGVDFEVYNNNREMYRFIPRATSLERIKEVITVSQLYEISHLSNGIRISGFMSSPFDTRSNTQKLYTYVNSRPVRDRFITRIIMDTYGKTLQKGKFPQGALFIDLPAGDVDVNVHPTKHEIKFKNQSLVGSVIKDAIGNMLSTAPWILGGVEGFRERSVKFRENTGSYYTPPVKSGGTAPPGREKFESGEGPSINYSEAQEITTQLQEEDKAEKDLFGEPGYFSNMKIIGQAGLLYIICESDSGLILIDQHAAHERVNYEIYKKHYINTGRIQKQELLLPEVIELAPKEFNLFQKHEGQIFELGFDAQQFGKKEVRVTSVPALLGAGAITEFFIDLLNELDEMGEGRSIKDKFDLICATMACHGSIRANQPMEHDKIYSLLKSLDEAENPHFCPHGRPVAKLLDFRELEKMFGRI